MRATNEAGRLRRTWTIGVLVATAVAGVVPLATAAPASAEAPPVRAASPTYGHPEVIRGSAPTLHPEGVGYDAGRGAFLVGSVPHGTVSVVGDDGSATTLVDDLALVTTMGLTVDQRRQRVLVVNADLGLADRSTPESTFELAGLGVYDARDGERLHYVDLAALLPGHQNFANDVALDSAGNAYVTDSLAGAVYRVSPAGEASVLVQDASLAGTTGGGWGLNGVVWHPDGYLIGALSAEKGLVRIPLDRPRDFQRVELASAIGSPDGMLLSRDGSLHLIDNTAANRLVELRSADGWSTARVERSMPWADPVPTTLTDTPQGPYVLTGRLDLLLAGTPSDEFTLRRVS